jgi:hypothetical protein
VNRALVCAALAAATACKRRSGDGPDEGINAMVRFADLMCGCRDKACADKVQDEMTRWASQQAKQASPSDKISESEVKTLQEVMTRYSECMTKVMAGDVAPAGTGSGGATIALDVTAVLRQVRDRVAKTGRKLEMSKLEIAYARADGMLDAEYGTLAIDYRVPPAPPADDPKRPIGAPLPPPPTGQTSMDCPSFSVEQGRIVEGKTLCMGFQSLTPPRCTVAQVWARAIADQAPKAALASLELHESDGAQSWSFAISDPPRNIDFKHLYPDDCVAVVERPAR